MKEYVVFCPNCKNKLEFLRSKNKKHYAYFKCTNCNFESNDFLVNKDLSTIFEVLGLKFVEVYSLAELLSVYSNKIVKFRRYGNEDTYLYHGPSGDIHYIGDGSLENSPLRSQAFFSSYDILKEKWYILEELNE